MKLERPRNGHPARLRWVCRLKACPCLIILILSALFIKWQYTNFIIGYNWGLNMEHGWALNLHTWHGLDGGCFGLAPILWITIIMGAGTSYLFFCCSAKYEYLITVFFKVFSTLFFFDKTYLIPILSRFYINYNWTKWG